MEKPATIWKQRLKPYPESYTLQFVRLWTFPFTYLLYHTPFAPTHITVLSFVARFIGSLFVGLELFGRGDYVIGALLIWVGMILDCADGEIARLKQKATTYGAWIDEITDRIADVIVLTGIALFAYHRDPSPMTLVVSYFAVAGTTLWRLLSHTTQQTFNIPKSTNPHPRIGFDSAAMYIIITVLLLLHQPVMILWIFAIMMTFAWVKNVLKDGIKYRNVS